MNKIVLLIVGLIISHSVTGQNTLLIPDTLSGTNINLALQTGTAQFFGGQPTATMGANGNILGPTLLINQGDQVSFSVDNQLGEPTTLHWHRLHVSSENDGGPHTSIAPNSVWTPSFTILDKAATYWYHPHLHEKTNEHVSKGIAGVIIVRDNEEAQLNLPRFYGIDDFPLVIQTKDFDANNQIVVHSNSDDVLMVNATIDPMLDVPSQVVRFRVLNGSSQRAFNLGLGNGQNIYQVASDGGLLSVPFQTTRLLLAPGERAEILLDFSGMNGQTIFLKSYGSELPNGIYGATFPGMGAGMTLAGYNPNLLNGADFNIIQLNIGGQTVSPIITIPPTLVTDNPISVDNANITRNLTFSPVAFGPNQLNGDFQINNSSFDIDVINFTIPLGNTEIWEIFNQSGISHPFHIHDVQFYILSRNGIPPPINEQGRKDVVLIRPMETIRFITKFEDFSNDQVPYMYHCHLLTHEDGGMMGQFIVSDPLPVTEVSNIGMKVNVFPNPIFDFATIEVEGLHEEWDFILYNSIGQIVRQSNNIVSQSIIIEKGNLIPGLYVFQIRTKKVLARAGKILVQ